MKAEDLIRELEGDVQLRYVNSSEGYSISSSNFKVIHNPTGEIILELEDNSDIWFRQEDRNSEVFKK